MNAEILAPLADNSTFYPLTEQRKLNDCRVANLSLYEAQVVELEASGFSIDAETSGYRLQVQANAFVVAEDLEKLKGRQQSCIIQSKSGEIIAWYAEGATVGDSALICHTSSSLFMTYAWDFLTLNEYIVNGIAADKIDGEIREGVVIDGHIEVGEGTTLLPGVYIEGNCRIGKNCKIGPNCYLRGPIAIGDNCHVGNAVEIKASMILDGASVGHLSYVGDSIIGEKANLGAGTITSNFRHDGKNHRAMVKGKLLDTGRRKFGAIIGDGVHTGIHTSIYPGRFIAPGASTLPGEVVRKNIEA